jgi:hypothetical protein
MNSRDANASGAPAPRRETRQKKRDRRIQKAVASRWAFAYLALSTLILAIFAGILVTIIDHKDFHNVGEAWWWAVVTLGTVGYGDVVPHSAWGRVVGTVVIILGVTFIAFLTANVTSLFVATQQEEQAELVDEQRASDLEETKALLYELINRVGAIEEKLDRPSGSDRLS